MNEHCFEIKTEKLILQLPKNLLYYENKVVILSTTEAKLLALFMINENEPLSIKEINIWLYEEDLVKHRFSLRVNIHYVREKIKKICSKEFISRCKNKTYTFMQNAR